MDFGEVVKTLKNDPSSCFRRRSWNAQWDRVSMEVRDAFRWTGLIVYVRFPGGISHNAPFTLCEEDLFADDWELVIG